MENKDVDVLIMGGGLAGLSLAIQLKQRLGDSPLSIVVLERNCHPVPVAAHKVGESLVELGAFYFSNVLGLKQHLIEAQLPKLGLRFFFKTREVDKDYRLRMEKSVEFGARYFPCSPSYQIDRGIFENFLARKCRDIGVEFIDETKVIGVDVTRKSERNVIFARHLNSQRESVFSARWLVDACSRSSPLKRRLSLTEESEHKISAAWFRLEVCLDVNSFSMCDEWRSLHTDDRSRWFSTNHFMGKGYWLWFIPLSSGSTSIGIVADNSLHPLESYNTVDRAILWLQKHEPLCAEKIEKHLDKLQDFRFLKNFSHSCKQVYSDNRWFLTGEAGVFLDPFYSPGSDFIAISNTFVCNLVEADYKGVEDFRRNCVLLNNFYLNLFGNTSVTYQGMYPIFGDTRVMPVKILWDFAVYWSFVAFLYIQGKFFETEKLFAIRKQFEELGSLNREMQSFFINWSSMEFCDARQQYIDPFDFEFMERLNKGLYEDLDDNGFELRFARNMIDLKLLFERIISAAIKEHPSLSSCCQQTISNLAENSFSVLLRGLKAE